MKIRIWIEWPNESVHERTVEVDRVITVGRAWSCAVRLPHPSVSARHLRVRVTDAGIGVQDADSSYGTYVGQRRLGPSEWAPVAEGDDVWAGDLRLRLATAAADAETFGGTVTLALPSLHVGRVRRLRLASGDRHVALSLDEAFPVTIDVSRLPGQQWPELRDELPLEIVGAEDGIAIVTASGWMSVLSEAPTQMLGVRVWIEEVAPDDALASSIAPVPELPTEDRDPSREPGDGALAEDAPEPEPSAADTAARDNPVAQPSIPPTAHRSGLDWTTVAIAAGVIGLLVVAGLAWWLFSG